MIVRFRRGHFRQRRPSLTPRWLCKFYFLKSFLVVPTAIATATSRNATAAPPDGSSTPSNGGSAAAIVAPIVVLLLAAATALAWFCCRQKQSTGNEHAAPAEIIESHACCRGSTGCFIWDLVCSVCNSCASWRCVLLNLHWYCSCGRAACLPVSAKT